MTSLAPAAQPRLRSISLADPRTSGNVAMIVTVLAWASYYPAIEVLVRSWDALSLSAVRVTLGALMLSTMLLVREGAKAFRGLPVLRLFLIGTFGFAAFMTLTPLGISMSSGASAALISAANPGIAAIFARFYFGDAIGKDTRVAVVVSLVGGAIVVCGGNGSVGLPGWGELACLGASVSWIWASMQMQRWFTDSSQLRIAALSSSAGALSLLVLWLVVWASGAIDLSLNMSATSFGLLFFTAVASNAVGYLLWNLGVKNLGISAASIYANMVPVVAVLFVVLIGQSVSPLQLVGGAVIVAGVLWAQLGSEGLSKAVRRLGSVRPPILGRWPLDMRRSR